MHFAKVSCASMVKGSGHLAVTAFPVNNKGRLHDKSLKITLSLNFRLTAVDCIKSGLTSLRLTLSLNSRLLAVDCMKQV